MEVLTIFDDVSEKKIFKPKVRRLIPHKRHNKPKTSSNNIININYWNNCDEKNPLFNLDRISLEEIKNDFTKLKYSQPLYYVLNLYFCFILETLNIKAETKKVDYVLNNKADLYLRPFIFDKCKVLNYFKNPKVYSYWNLKDIKKTIIRVQDRDKYLLLKEYTSKMEDFVEYCKGAAEISPW